MGVKMDADTYNGYESTVNPSIANTTTKIVYEAKNATTYQNDCQKTFDSVWIPVAESI